MDSGSSRRRRAQPERGVVLIDEGIATPAPARREDSSVNTLIGSKKFTEGWNSCRASAMGLMNVGSTEGSQTSQLFGRGARLKGYDRSLKRSVRVNLPDDVARPGHLATLETLNIFGIKVDYMARFREFLEEEGLPSNEGTYRVPTAGDS